MEDEHDFRKTIHDATFLESDDAALMRERHMDADAAYESLALTSSMGMFGMEETAANLMQLEMAQEMLYKFALDAKDDRNYNEHTPDTDGDN